MKSKTASTQAIPITINGENAVLATQGWTMGVIHSQSWPGAQYGAKLVSAQFVDGRIEMVYRQPSMTSNNWGSTPDRVWKEIYEARDGAIVLARKITGEIIPAVEEQLVFDDEGESDSR